ncbi:FadR/GntR family transcriptional regulator [Agromyces sp. MMS24-K17]|uniref:FadR/GntR family transcriptional regulator n=1 Tax=Agromyces sp. MMS24-K17 TaxID=3372850 RepID=UPI00375520A0
MRPNVVAQVTEFFHDQVRSGAWPVGERIPVEKELVEITGAGRNAVREGVQALVQAGLLRREQGRGTFVLANSALTTTITRRVTHASREHVLQLRHAIDASAAALAAEHHDLADAARLRGALAVRTESWRRASVPDRIRADLDLHRAIVLATGNPLYVELFDGLADAFEAELEHDVQGDDDAHADQHERLVAAILDRDPAAAAAWIDRLFDTLD